MTGNKAYKKNHFNIHQEVIFYPEDFLEILGKLKL
jgi:hypothetical protein